MDKVTFEKNVSKDPNGCWLWIKSITSAGYGQLTVNKQYFTAHRYSYMLYNGILSDSDVVRHTCHTPRCCNPAHLIKGTHKDNYHDSKHMHDTASSRRAMQWIVNDKVYTGLKQAIQHTGICSVTLIKYTDKNTRVFCTTGYRKACVIAGVTPKV